MWVYCPGREVPGAVGKGLDGKDDGNHGARFCLSSRHLAREFRAGLLPLTANLTMGESVTIQEVFFDQRKTLFKFT